MDLNDDQLLILSEAYEQFIHHKKLNNVQKDHILQIIENLQVTQDIGQGYMQYDFEYLIQEIVIKSKDLDNIKNQKIDQIMQNVKDITQLKKALIDISLMLSINQKALNVRSFESFDVSEFFNLQSHPYFFQNVTHPLEKKTQEILREAYLKFEDQKSIQFCETQEYFNYFKNIQSFQTNQRKNLIEFYFKQRYQYFLLLQKFYGIDNSLYMVSQGHIPSYLEESLNKFQSILMHCVSKDFGFLKGEMLIEFRQQQVDNIMCQFYLKIVLDIFMKNIQIVDVSLEQGINYLVQMLEVFEFFYDNLDQKKLINKQVQIQQIFEKINIIIKKMIQVRLNEILQFFLNEVDSQQVLFQSLEQKPNIKQALLPYKDDDYIHLHNDTQDDLNKFQDQLNDDFSILKLSTNFDFKENVQRKKLRNKISYEKSMDVYKCTLDLQKIEKFNYKIMKDKINIQNDMHFFITNVEKALSQIFQWGEKFGDIPVISSFFQQIFEVINMIFIDAVKKLQIQAIEYTEINVDIKYQLAIQTDIIFLFDKLNQYFICLKIPANQFILNQFNYSIIEEISKIQQTIKNNFIQQFKILTNCHLHQDWATSNPFLQKLDMPIFKIYQDFEISQILEQKDNRKDSMINLELLENNENKSENDEQEQIDEQEQHEEQEQQANDQQYNGNTQQEDSFIEQDKDQSNKSFQTIKSESYKSLDQSMQLKNQISYGVLHSFIYLDKQIVEIQDQFQKTRIQQLKLIVDICIKAVKELKNNFEMIKVHNSKQYLFENDIIFTINKCEQYFWVLNLMMISIVQGDFNYSDLNSDFYGKSIFRSENVFKKIALFWIYLQYFIQIQEQLNTRKILDLPLLDKQQLINTLNFKQDRFIHFYINYFQSQFPNTETHFHPYVNFHQDFLHYFFKNAPLKQNLNQIKYNYDNIKQQQHILIKKYKQLLKHENLKFAQKELQLVEYSKDKQNKKYFNYLNNGSIILQNQF